MSTLSIQADQLGLRSAPAGSGSPAERAYRRAVKALAAAQNRLSKDLGERADEATIKQDRMAVQQAAAAVAEALAALAREKDEPKKRPLSVLAAVVEAKSIVDLYA